MLLATDTWPEWLWHHKSFAVLFLAAALATVAATPLFIRVALRLGWVDRPGGRKAHSRPTPTLGGVVVFVPVFAGALIALSWNNRVGEMLREHSLHVLGALGCTAVAIVVGVVDDLRGVRPKIKLLFQLLIAVSAYFLGFSITALTLPGVGSVVVGGVSFVLTVGWIVAVINAINFTDGLDGLAAGVGFLAAAVNAGVAIWLGNYYMAVTMLLLAGALLGFLRWNFHPAAIFLGDSGSLGLGTFLALCSLHSAQKAQTAVMILVPLCALGYPIFDMLLAVARRTLRGQPVWTSDRDHIHHRLQDRGHSASQTAVIIYGASLALIGAGLFSMTANHVVVGLIIGGVLLLAVFSIRVLGYIEWSSWSERRETRIVHAAAHLARLKMAAAKTPQQAVDALGVVAAELGITRVSLTHGDCCASWPSPAGTAPPDVDAVELSLRDGWTIRAWPPQGTAVGPDGASLLDDVARRLPPELDMSKSDAR